MVAYYAVCVLVCAVASVTSQGYLGSSLDLGALPAYSADKGAGQTLNRAGQSQPDNLPQDQLADEVGQVPTDNQDIAPSSTNARPASRGQESRRPQSGSQNIPQSGFSSGSEDEFQGQPQNPTGSQNGFQRRPQTGTQGSQNVPQSGFSSGTEDDFQGQPQNPTGSQNGFQRRPQTGSQGSQNIPQSGFSSGTEDDFQGQPQNPTGSQNGFQRRPQTGSQNIPQTRYPAGYGGDFHRRPQNGFPRGPPHGFKHPEFGHHPDYHVFPPGPPPPHYDHRHLEYDHHHRY